MDFSPNYGLNLPSRDNDTDIADINQLSTNFRIIDEELAKTASKESVEQLELNVSEKNNEFSNRILALEENKQDKLTAGDNVNINSNNVISVTVDQTYTPESANAQSGVAVAGAIADKPNLFKGTEISIDIGDIVGIGFDDIPERWATLKVGDLYYNTEEQKTYQCISVDFTNNRLRAEFKAFGSGDITVDQIYNPTSENAQSGKAVAEAISNLSVEGLPTIYQEEPKLGSNLLSGNEVWTSAGWSGSASSGWTHTSGNTSQLKVPVSIESGAYYVVEFDANADIADNALTVTLGGSDAYSIYWGGMGLLYYVGIKTVNTNELTFIPASNYTGKITNIIVKKIIKVSQPYLSVEDSIGNITLEIRPTDSNRDSLYFGASSGGQDVGGNGNVGIGIEALSKNVSGFWNTAIGRLAMRDNVGGTRNTAIGQSALLTNLYGHRNIAVGSYVLNANKTGNENVGVGVDTLYDNVDGTGNVAVGFMALTNNVSGDENVAIGKYTASGMKTGNYNVALGASALPACTSGSNNMAIGNSSLYRNTTGSNNVAIGSLAGRGASGGGAYHQNIFIGANSAKNITNGCTGNIVIGTNAAASLADGARCIVIGHECDIPTGSYKLNIGELIKGSMLSTNKYLEVDGGMQINALPTTDPKIVGRLWNDNGVVKVSAG